MVPRQKAQADWFDGVSLEDHVHQEHPLRSIDRFIDLTGVRAVLAEFYSRTGRTSGDPE